MKGKNKNLSRASLNSNFQILTSDHRGITLIALVITIIVMLILVAVTINMAVNGGLFGYASNAARQTNEAIEQEKKLGDVKPGLTTDQLIAKYTGDTRAEDIMKLKQLIEAMREQRVNLIQDEGKLFFPHGIEPIPDADESIEVIAAGPGELLIEYNKYKYVVNVRPYSDLQR